MTEILRWSAKRIMITAATLVGIAIVVFVAVRQMPGGYENVVLGPLVTDEQRQAAVERFGLDQPVVVQFWHWLTAAVRGDFGVSLVSQVPVTQELALRIPMTMTLAIMALVIAVLVGVPLGVMTGLRSTSHSGGVWGRLASGLGISVPEFVLGSVVLFVVSTIAAGTAASPPGTDGSLLATVSSLILPSLVLGLYCLSATARATRDAVMGVLVEPHIEAAVARGERPWHIVVHHVLRNASVPVLTFVGTMAAYLLGGAVIVETVFDIPGVGSYMVTGLGRHDYAVVQATVLLAALVFVLINTAIDLAASVVDPRIAVAGGRS